MMKTIQERVQLFFENNTPTNQSKWDYWVSQAKKKFDVYPSAYANAWAAKQYKKSGGGWKKKSNEELKPAVLDIGRETKSYFKKKYDEPNYLDTEYYTGM